MLFCLFNAHSVGVGEYQSICEVHKGLQIYGCIKWTLIIIWFKKKKPFDKSLFAESSSCKDKLRNDCFLNVLLGKTEKCYLKSS